MDDDHPSVKYQSNTIDQYISFTTVELGVTNQTQSAIQDTPCSCLRTNGSPANQSMPTVSLKEAYPQLSYTS